MEPAAPIVLIDSGLGGLTVARAIHDLLPHEQILYFGDTARVPYGTKSPQAITKCVLQIARHLASVRPKHLVIACNTASAVALPALRAGLGALLPGVGVTGVIDPGARAAAAAAGNVLRPVIGVIATEATIQSKAYERAIAQKRAKARVLLKPAPLLVPIVEEGRPHDDPVAVLAVEQYLRPLLKRNIQVLVMGCTHYPLLRPTIELVAGDSVSVVDSASACAEDVSRRLTSSFLLRPGLQDSPRRHWLRAMVTDHPQRFARLAERFLGEAIEEVTWVQPDALEGPLTDEVAEEAARWRRPA